jgi:hypothetical protein
MEDERKANFTSSSIWRLAVPGRKNGEPSANFYSYVEEKKAEIIAGRTLSNEARSTSLDWGNMCESLAQRYKHEDLPWSGMPDGLKGPDVVTDIKSPWTLASFMAVYMPIFHTGKIKPEETTVSELLKKSKKEWYWQLISNSILTKRTVCELILFMPKRKLLEEIRAISQNSGKYYFHNKTDFELPWTSENSEINTITKIQFEAPEADVQHLKERVQLAANLLNK